MYTVQVHTNYTRTLVFAPIQIDDRGLTGRLAFSGGHQIELSYSILLLKPGENFVQVPVLYILVCLLK